MNPIIKIENLSKQYRLGVVGTGTIRNDLKRWWYRTRGKDDPFLKIGDTNQRGIKGKSDYVWALKDINLEVMPGEILGIIGKNGAGKSTLLKILSKVTGPTTGSIAFNGRIGSLLEVGTGFHPELTGRENIFLNGAILGMTKAEIRRKLDEIIDFSGVERYIDTPVKRYSSGMMVRLGFAVAAHLEPEILVVDEVLAVGDAEFQKKAIGKMQDISKEQGRTVLFVSHNMGSIKALCNKGVVLKDGQVQYSGSINNAVDRYLNYSKQFLKIPLSQRKDRSGNFELEATYIMITSISGISLDSVMTGQDIKIILGYKKNIIGNCNNVNVSFSMTDTNEAPLFLIHNRLTGDKIDVKQTTGEFECTINRFPLNEGIYLLSYSIMKGNDFIDGIQNAFELKVEKGKFYSTGEIAPKDFGPLLINGRFTHK